MENDEVEEFTALSENVFPNDQDFDMMRLQTISALSKDPGIFTLEAYKVTTLGYTQSSKYFPVDDVICQATDLAEYPINNTEIKLLGQRGRIGVPYILTVNRPNGYEQYVLKKSPVVPAILYSRTPPTDLQNLIPYKNDLQICGFPSLENLNYIGSDEFTNETLIAYILDYVYSRYGLNQQGMKTYLKHFLGFVCKSNGYNLMEYADLGTLDRIGDDDKWQAYRHSIPIFSNTNVSRREVVKPEYLIKIFKQVIANLHFLQTTIQFTSSDCKSANIFVSNQPIKVDYEGLILDCPFTCKIGDYGKSSLTIGLTNQNIPYRLFNRDWKSDQYLRFSPFTPHIETLEDIPYYTVSNLFLAQLYTRLRHMGIPFYLSFDTYTFIVSMLLDPAVFYSFFGNDDMVKYIWEPLWFQDDLQEIFSRIQKSISQGKGGSYQNTVPLLMNIKLKCHATTILFDSIKSLPF